MRILMLVSSLILLLVLASTAAVWSYGRFAERARGPEQLALPTGETTRLDRLVAPQLRSRPGASGLRFLESDLAAFALRAGSAAAAERSLDLQYYYWRNDLTGRLMLRQVLGAADRGVRVRLLLDDINVQGDDGHFLALDRHPAIEVRLFNPSRNRGDAFRRGIELLLRAHSANRRMHNKTWIADGRLAVIGGRNIGDAYFAASRGANFRDVDLAMVGPIVDAAESLFDRFWNSDAVLPIRGLADNRRADDLATLRRRLDQVGENAGIEAYQAALGGLDLDERMAHERFLWTTEARLLADPPEKGRGEGEEEWLIHALLPPLLTAGRELTVISPYFVPGDDGMAIIRDLRERDVALTVLTNSLAATDVAAVHGGYAPYRAPMLEAGVALFELKPEAGAQRLSVFGSTSASLHTKAFLVDEATGFVGSFNFDPRSVSLNTEMGVLFVDRDLARELRHIARGKLAPEVSYRLFLEDGALAWEDRSTDPPSIHRREPEAGFWRRLVASIVRWLPVESQL